MKAQKPSIVIYQKRKGAKLTLRTLLKMKQLAKWLTSFYNSKYETKIFVKSTSKMPFKKRAQDGGFDFYVDLIDSGITEGHYLLQPGEVKKFSVGAHCRFPTETVWSWDVRSSAGLKGLGLTAHTIDCEYTGCLSIVVVNHTHSQIRIEAHERIAQLIPNPFSSKYYFEQVDRLSDLGTSGRGSSGFGSSGT